MTARVYIRDAMKDLGVLAAGEVPSADEMADGLVALNGLADALGLDRLTLYTLTRTTKTLASGTASYTIGTGGSINLERPTWIDHAGLILDTGASTPIEVPIDVLTDEDYAAWSMKTEQQSQSRAIWYNHGFAASLGLIYPLPIPNVATTQLVLYTPGGMVTAFSTADTDLVAPRGYTRMLRKWLALEIAPMFLVEPSAGLIRQAVDARNMVLGANVRTRRRVSSPGLAGGAGVWNADSGGVR